MPSSDYVSTVSGGLKLKGAAKDAGVKKKRKDKDKSKAGGSGKKDKAATPVPAEEDETTQLRKKEEEAGDKAVERRESPVPATAAGSGKTEAQLRHEEIKRKRVSGHFVTIERSVD